MADDTPRGIAVLDVGATNTKALLFDHALNVVAEESVPSARQEGPPYLAIDAEPILDLSARILPEFDKILPVDAVVPCTHGSALALLDEAGGLALPIMDYNALPPDDVVVDYARAAPAFDEVLAPINPGGLTLARQLWWQETAWPDVFKDVRTLLPFAQYLAHRLGGRKVAEVTSWGAQSHLWDMRGGTASSIARRKGWEALMAAPTSAWQIVGRLDTRFCGAGLRGTAQICAGIHDSSANFLRYAGAETGRFALLSTGTWIIGFDNGADPSQLDPACDTACGLTIEGATVPICRFKGGEEYAILAEDGPPPELTHVANILSRGVMALPNFTASGGPCPGAKGRLVGDVGAAERASLAALYCAQMTTLALEAMSGQPPQRIVVDGPFGQNEVYLSILAALVPDSVILASTLREGTAAGAALLALADRQTGALPNLPVSLATVTKAALPALADYHDLWRQMARGRL